MCAEREALRRRLRPDWTAVHQSSSPECSESPSGKAGSDLCNRLTYSVAGASRNEVCRSITAVRERVVDRGLCTQKRRYLCRLALLAGEVCGCGRARRDSRLRDESCRATGSWRAGRVTRQSRMTVVRSSRTARCSASASRLRGTSPPRMAPSRLAAPPATVAHRWVMRQRLAVHAHSAPSSFVVSEPASRQGVIGEFVEVSMEHLVPSRFERHWNGHQRRSAHIVDDVAGPERTASIRRLLMRVLHAPVYGGERPGWRRDRTPTARSLGMRSSSIRQWQPIDDGGTRWGCCPSGLDAPANVPGARVPLSGVPRTTYGCAVMRRRSREGIGEWRGTVRTRTVSRRRIPAPVFAAGLSEV
jgi:hypothetical protein